MIFKLKLEMGGAGVRDADDVAGLLADIIPRVAAKVGEDGEFGLIRDAENNRIGRWDFSEKDHGDFVVGEDDTTDQVADDHAWYYDEDGDTRWECTRARGHKGVHAHGNGDTIQAVWFDVYGG